MGPTFVDQEAATWPAVDACEACPPETPACGWTPWIWGRAEYLLWWTDGMDVPPLVTTSPSGTSQDEAGVLGQSGTSILYGNTGLNSDARSGGRFTLGLWLDSCGCRGIEATYMTLGTKTETFGASSDDFTILARPFFNVVTGEQDAHLIAFEDPVDGPVFEGSVGVRSETGFQDLEVLFRRQLYQHCTSRLDFLAGYQYARLDDELRIDESVVSLAEGAVPVETTIELYDLFETSNDFHGAKLGVVFRERVCRWSLELLMTLGLGSTHSRVVIDGSTITTVPNEDPETTPGGGLALPTNMGAYEQDHFTMIPELGVTLGYDVTCGLRATFGYNFIYWSKVARPGDQIDLDVNDTQFGGGDLEGAPWPQFSWATTDFWAHGLKFGLEYRF